MKTPKELYRLDELAGRWSQTEEDILDMASSCDLVISTSPTYHSTEDLHEGEWLDLSSMVQPKPEDLKAFIPPLIKEPNYSEIKAIHPLSVYQNGKQFFCDEKPWIEVFRDNLFVLSDEVARMEEKYPDLVNKAPWQGIEQQEKTPEYDTAFDVRCIKKALLRELEKLEQLPRTDITIKTIPEYSRNLNAITAWEQNHNTQYPALDPAVLELPGVALGNDSVLKQRLLEKISEPIPSQSQHAEQQENSMKLPDDGRNKLSGKKAICKFYIVDIKHREFPLNKKANDFNEWKTIRSKLARCCYLRYTDKTPWTTPSAMEKIFFE